MRRVFNKGKLQADKPDHSDKLISNATSDADLILAIAQSDQAAYRQLFNRFYKVLLGTAVNIIKDEDSGKDAVQDVFLQVWKTRETLKVTSSVPSYLKRAVINRCLNAIRKEQKYEDESEFVDRPSDAPTPIEILEAEDLQKVIDTALRSIPERSRLAYILKRQEGLSLKEIAEKLDISPKTVENQITKALKILKEAVEPYMEKYNNST